MLPIVKIYTSGTIFSGPFRNSFPFSTEMENISFPSIEVTLTSVGDNSRNLPDNVKPF